MSSALTIPDHANPSALVPVDPDHSTDERAQELTDRQQDCPDLLQYLKKTFKAIKSHREEDWRRNLRSQVRCQMYYDDRQYGEVTPEGVWRDFDRSPGDIRPIDNQFKIQCDKLLMEMARSFPNLSVKASDTNDTVMVEGAKFAKYRLDTNRKHLIKNTFKLREAQALLLKAITYRYTFFDKNAEDTPIERKPTKSKKQFGSTRSLVTCKLCGSPMKPVGSNGTAEMKCINCGSSKQNTIQVSEQEKEVIDGYNEVRGGRVTTHHIDGTMVRISPDARESVADSPFLWYQQMVMRCILEAAYPDIKIPSASDLSEAQRYQQDAERSPSNTQDAGFYNKANTNSEGGHQFEELPFDLFWIDPVVYQDYKSNRDQTLRGGRMLHADETLTELFPDGMCLAVSGDTILDVYPENKNKKWVFCVYGIREHALVGSGVNALLGPQDTRNDLKAYMIANTYYNAAPREFVRAGGITGNQLPALNQVAIVTNAPEDKPIKGWAYDKSEGSPLPAQTFEMYQAEGGSLQEGAGTSSLSAEGTAVDKAMGTATGVAAMRDQAVGRMGPNLMLLTAMEEDHGYQILAHEQEHFSPERYMRMANQSIATEESDGSLSFSAEGIKAFMKMNVRADLVIEAEPGSWMPKTEAERQAKLTGFGTFVAELLNKMPPNPLTGATDPRVEELIAIAADVFGVDIDQGWNATDRAAASRLKEYAQTVGIVEKHGIKLPSSPPPALSADPNDPTAHPFDALKPPPPHPLVITVIQMTPQAAMNPEMDNHAAYIQFYKKWWVSDEGLACSPMLRAVVQQLAIDHRTKGMVYEATQMSLDKMSAEAPQMIAAQQTAKENQPQGGGDATKISVAYKDLPEDVKRQEEARLGFQPSQTGALPESDGTGAEHVKGVVALATQEHKSQLEQDTATHEAKLQLATQQHAHDLKVEQESIAHEREKELQSREQSHAEGIRGAELLSEHAMSAQDRQHESTEKSKEREHSSVEGAATREHAEKIVKLKPKPTENKK